MIGNEGSKNQVTESEATFNLWSSERQQAAGGPRAPLRHVTETNTGTNVWRSDARDCVTIVTIVWCQYKQTFKLPH